MSALPAGVRGRVWLWAALLRPLKHLVPLERLIRIMRARPRGPRSPAFEADLAAFLTATGPFPRRPPSNCLERSLAAYRLLGAAGAQPVIVVGFRRITPRRLDGHVWVTVDGAPFGERAGALDDYVSVVRYDAIGQRHPAAEAGEGPIDVNTLR